MKIYSRRERRSYQVQWYIISANVFATATEKTSVPSRGNKYQLRTKWDWARDFHLDVAKQHDVSLWCFNEDLPKMTSIVPPTDSLIKNKISWISSDSAIAVSDWARLGGRLADFYRPAKEIKPVSGADPDWLTPFYGNRSNFRNDSKSILERKI